ncbi:MAG: hypothetical protein OHK0013_37950 [Sandaracinaceae bacterium]
MVSVRSSSVLVPMAVLAVLPTGCVIDRSPLGGGSEADAFVGTDAFSPIDADLDAHREDAWSDLDAYRDDAFTLDDAGMDAFSPDAFSPDAFSPDAFSIDAFVPGADAYTFSDLVAWYPFDTINDATGKGHTLEASNVMFVERYASFMDESRLETPDAADLDEVRAISFWVSRGDDRRNMALVCRPDTYVVRIDDMNRVVCTMYGSSLIASSPIPRDAWVHVACVVDGSNVVLYVDGSAVGRSMGTPRPGSEPLRLGNGCRADEHRGSMSDVRLYNRTLTGEDISALFARRP